MNDAPRSRYMYIKIFIFSRLEIWKTRRLSRTDYTSCISSVWSTHLNLKMSYDVYQVNNHIVTTAHTCMIGIDDSDSCCFL